MSWENYYGNVDCEPARLLRPKSVDELLAVIAEARGLEVTVRPVGAGHSNTPLVPTAGDLVSLDDLAGITDVDPVAGTFTARAGTRLRDVGDELWEHGLALENQGDIHDQALAGMVSTATHGTGIGLHSFSGQLLGAELATAESELIALSPVADGEVFRAARVALGALGVFTSLTFPAIPAYSLREHWVTLSFDEALERWETFLSRHRHCTFCWNPQDDSAARWGRPPAPADSVSVRLMDPEDPEADPYRGDLERLDRSYRIFADEYEPDFAELEYEVPAADGPAALTALRDLIRRDWPAAAFPVDVRFAAADDGYLSPSGGRATAILAPCGGWTEDQVDFSRECHRVLNEFDARPHWGKLHFFDYEMVSSRFPDADQFRAVRERLDPEGRFLNDHLRSLLVGQ